MPSSITIYVFYKRMLESRGYSYSINKLHVNVTSTVKIPANDIPEFALTLDFYSLDEPSEQRDDPDIIPDQIASLLQKLFSIS